MSTITNRSRRVMHVALAGVTVCALAITLEAFGEHDSDPIAQNGLALIQAGRQTFRFDTFGDEEYWGDTFKLHRSIEGSALGGVGPGVSPATALAVGLRLDADALPATLVDDVRNGRVDREQPRYYAGPAEAQRGDWCDGLLQFGRNNEITGNPMRPVPLNR